MAAKKPVVDQREGWLRNLKPGDNVIVRGHGGNRSICTVTDITPKGTIFVGKHREEFKPNGDARVGDIWSRNTLTPYTEEVAAVIRRANYRRNFKRLFNLDVMDEAALDALSDERVAPLMTALWPLRKKQ